MMVGCALLAAALQGPFPILLTPWTEEAKLDVPTLVKEAEYVESCGVGGIIWPSAGEMKELERSGEYETGLAALIERSLRPGAEFKAQLTVIVSGSNQVDGVERAARVERLARDFGTSIVVLARPCDNAVDQKMIAEYYRALAKVLTQRVIIQTHNGKSPQPDVELLVELARENPRIFGYVKEESPGLEVNGRMERLLAHPEIKGVFSGWGGKGWVFQGTRIGTCGVISQRAAYASLFATIWRRMQAGADASDPELARAYSGYLYMANLGDIFSRWGDDEMRGDNLYVLMKLGIFKNLLTREEGVVKPWPMTEKQKAEVEARMRFVGLAASRSKLGFQK